MKRIFAFTLTKVFHSAVRRKIAFTLAEVLITLGIIGVVAAITLPLLIQNYHKKQTAVRLEKAYAEINQAVRLAEVQNGPFYKHWDIQRSNGGWLSANTDFFENYLGKNIKFVKTCTPSSDECWKMPENDLTEARVFSYTPYSSQFVSAVTSGGYSIYGWLGGETVNGVMSSNHFQFFIDIDGPNKGKQVLGKDIFHAIYDFKSSKDYLAVGKDRDELFELCELRGQCLGLIMHEGWEIPDDYPHKL